MHLINVVGLLILTRQRLESIKKVFLIGEVESVSPGGPAFSHRQSPTSQQDHYNRETRFS